MTVEVPKTICQKCSDSKCDECSNPENCWCERYKHETPEIVCQNCKENNCDKCNFPDRCRCAYYKHSDSALIGVKVDKSKVVDEKSIKDFENVNKNLKDDQELKHELRMLWQSVRSHEKGFDEKQTMRKRMDELHLTLGIKKKVWLPDDKQKEFDVAWEIMGLKSGKGVKQKKDNAKIIINKLMKELGEHPYFDLEFDGSWLGYARLVMNEEHFLTPMSALSLCL